MDRTAKLFNTDAGRVVSTLSGHSRALTAAAFHPSQDLMFTASADKTARVWAPAEGASTCLHVLQDHDDTVTGVSVQPTGNYFATASADNSWVLYDLAAGKRLLRTGQSVESGGFTCLQFHPDGMILGTGASNNVVRVWDMKTAGNVATFTGHTGAVSSISFSENGYYMASGSQDGSVKLWDLRKLKDVATLDAGAAVESVCFDFSGTYLAAAGADIRCVRAAAAAHPRRVSRLRSPAAQHVCGQGNQAHSHAGQPHGRGQRRAVCPQRAVPGVRVHGPLAARLWHIGVRVLRAMSGCNADRQAE